MVLCAISFATDPFVTLLLCVTSFIPRPPAHFGPHFVHPTPHYRCWCCCHYDIAPIIPPAMCSSRWWWFQRCSFCCVVGELLWNYIVRVHIYVWIPTPYITIYIPPHVTHPRILPIPTRSSSPDSTFRLYDLLHMCCCCVRYSICWCWYSITFDCVHLLTTRYTVIITMITITIRYSLRFVNYWFYSTLLHCWCPYSCYLCVDYWWWCSFVWWYILGPPHHYYSERSLPLPVAHAFNCVAMCE